MDIFLVAHEARFFANQQTQAARLAVADTTDFGFEYYICLK